MNSKHFGEMFENLLYIRKNLKNQKINIMI